MGVDSSSGEIDLRGVRPADAAAIASIYNLAVSERVATFRTEPRRPGELESEVAGDSGLMIVAERSGEVVGMAWTTPYSNASFYREIAECAVYVALSARRTGAGRALLNALCERAAAAGLHKLTAKIFTANGPSIAIFEACGFRRVGVHERHGRLDGQWCDVLIAERSLAAAEVLAAGGAVVRHDGEEPRIAVVHRPRYGDWSLPKGKLSGAETFAEAALREVEEETGLRCRLVEELSPAAYTDSKGRSKGVRYWLMEPVEGEFEPNREVDELRWIGRREVDELLSYDRDRKLAREALEVAAAILRE